MTISKPNQTLTKDSVYAAFVAYFEDEFFSGHQAEIDTTSPYAVTRELPTLRVVDNAIIEGGGSTGSSTEERHGFFGGLKSATTTTSGSWELHTTVQFDHISMCPITGREFTDEELATYRDGWLRRMRAHARDRVSDLRREDDAATGVVRYLVGNRVFTFRRADLERFDPLASITRDLVDFIGQCESKGVAQRGDAS